MSPQSFRLKIIIYQVEFYGNLHLETTQSEFWPKLFINFLGPVTHILGS